MKKTLCALLLSLILISSMLYFSPKSNYTFKFEDVVVFYPQHQDDEVLWAGSAIVQALKQCGKDNVYVVLVSDGSGIKYFKNNFFENWTRKGKSHLRKNEFLYSLNSLGVKSSNVILLDELKKDPNVDFEQMKDFALYFEKKYNGHVTHVAHTYSLDWHNQHINNGKVIKELYNSGKISYCAFFVKPQYEKFIPLQKKIILSASCRDEYDKVYKACNGYKQIDKSNDFYGIGYNSDHKSFDKLLGNALVPSILHSPGL